MLAAIHALFPILHIYYIYKQKYRETMAVKLHQRVVYTLNISHCVFVTV